MNPDQQLLHEARMRNRQAIVAVLAGLLLVAAAAIQLGGAHTKVDELTRSSSKVAAAPAGRANAAQAPQRSRGEEPKGQEPGGHPTSQRAGRPAGFTDFDGIPTTEATPLRLAAEA